MSVERSSDAPVQGGGDALAALTAIISALASGESLDRRVEHGLATLHAELGANSCLIWLCMPEGLARTWGAGTDVCTAADVARGLIETDADTRLTVERVAVGTALSGALVVTAGRALAGHERTLIRAAARLFAPHIAQAEERRQLEVEVRSRTADIDRERRFTEKIIDSLPVGLYVIDRNYRIQAWNRKRETGMQGVSRDQAIGRTIFEILHRQPAEMLRLEFDDVASTGRIREYHVESMASGVMRTYRITKIPMRLADAGVTHVITIGEDVTDWKGAQLRFAQAEKLAAIGQLSAGVMHEINNPLATIAACANGVTLRLQDLGPNGADIPVDVIEYLDIIDQEVERCKGIVDGLLDFSRPKQSHREPVSLNATIERTLLLLKLHDRFRKLSVRTELDPALASVRDANAEQLVQVFMALLLNAMDASADDGGIHVSTRASETPGWVVAEVTDAGTGIPRTELSRIFEPFYTTKPPGRGTGLGLSICYGIVQDHAGRIEVESVPGQGSTFRVTLPTLEGT